MTHSYDERATGWAQRVVAGESVSAVARSESVSRETVRRRIAVLGVTPRAARTALRGRMIDAAAPLIVAERERWVPARFSERPFSREEFERRLELSDPALLLRWRAAQSLPVSYSGAASPDGRTCLVCGERLPWSEFYANASSPTGHASSCKECAAAEVRRYQELRDTPVPTVTSKRCSRCGVVKPASEFWRRRSASSGLQSWCKGCQREEVRGAEVEADEGQGSVEGAVEA